MNLSIFSSAMEGIAWRGWLYTVFILHFAFACQFLLLEPLVQSILLRGKESFSPAYACGFYCNGDCNTYLFVVFIAGAKYALTASAASRSPRVVWSANRNNLVKIGATLELTSKGNLVLKDADGTVAWSTNTFGKSVVGLNLTDLGNLVLFDKDNVTVWQSFDEPTDSLVLGQKLRQGQRLMPSVSETNWTVDGMIMLSMNGSALFAQMETNPPQIYFKYGFLAWNTSIEFPYVQFVNGSLSWFSDSTLNVSFISVPQASSAQYMKLGSDGHLRVYEFARYIGWNEVADLFTLSIGFCGYPTACGQYGICSNGQCSCPASSGWESYFRQVNDRQPNLGCSENVPLSCGASQTQSLMELENVTYFSFTPDLKDINASSCKEALRK
ncbi:hypothetical protein NL676_002854 [Syzygium grande]|nr:hypothetical protein NL676_002854 [Syzygium grande]